MYLGLNATGFHTWFLGKRIWWIRCVTQQSCVNFSQLMWANSVMGTFFGEVINIHTWSLRYFRKLQWANVEAWLRNSNLLLQLCNWHFWYCALTTCLNDAKKLIELIRKGLVTFRSSLLSEWLCCNISMPPVKTVGRSLKYCHLFRGHFSSHSYVRLPARTGVRLFLLQNRIYEMMMWRLMSGLLLVRFRFPAESLLRETRNIFFLKRGGSGVGNNNWEDCELRT